MAKPEERQAWIFVWDWSTHRVLSMVHVPNVPKASFRDIMSAEGSEDIETYVLELDTFDPEEAAEAFDVFIHNERRFYKALDELN